MSRVNRMGQVARELEVRGHGTFDRLPSGGLQAIADSLGCSYSAAQSALFQLRSSIALAELPEPLPRAGDLPRCDTPDCLLGATEQIGRTRYCPPCAANFLRWYGVTP